MHLVGVPKLITFNLRDAQAKHSDCPANFKGLKKDIGTRTRSQSASRGAAFKTLCCELVDSLHCLQCLDMVAEILYTH